MLLLIVIFNFRNACCWLTQWYCSNHVCCWLLFYSPVDCCISCNLEFWLLVLYLLSGCAHYNYDLVTNNCTRLLRWTAYRVVALWLSPPPPCFLLHPYQPINRPGVYLFYWHPPPLLIAASLFLSDVDWRVPACWLLCPQYFRVLVAEFLLLVAVVVAVDDQFRIIASVDVTSSGSLWSWVVVTSVLSSSRARNKHLGKPPINVVRSMFIVVSFVVRSGRSPGSPRHHQLLCISSLIRPTHTSDCCMC